VAREVYRFAVTVPAGTPLAAPQVSALKLPERTVRRITVVVPPGPRGLVGFQLTSGGLQVVPINQGQFVTADGEKIAWDLDDQLTSGAWQMTAYNTGAFNHTLEVRFEVDVVQPAAALLGPQPLPVDSLLP
jgi:hypothetical protein